MARVCWVFAGVFLSVALEGLTGQGRPGDEGETREARQSRIQQFALTHDGDPKRGAALFRDADRTRCLVCHKVEGKGGEVGPDLSAIGGKFARPHLIESLLEPSEEIVEGFRASVIALKDGRVEMGLVKRESEAGLTLTDANGKERSFSRAEIEDRREASQSLMPEGLADALKPEEFTDLIAYLESLRSGVNGAPGSNVSGGVHLPEGFEVAVVTTGLTGCTAMETTADGRVLICEQTGSLRVIENGRLLDRPALSLEVDHHWERGLIGVTVDPDFPESRYLYICYVAQSPYPHHRVSRFSMRGNLAEPGSEFILLRGDDQAKLGGHIPAGHQGGALHFGLDGKLYVSIGDQTAGAPSQKLDTFQGKVLRINRDGSIPEDNPFVSKTTGKYRAIWALGLRNPFTFAIDRTRGIMCINDVGEKFEEINRGVAGGNYGWPVMDGPSTDPRFVSPLYSYPHASVCGGDFVPQGAGWPQVFGGQYLFADFIHGWIKAVDPDHPGRVETFVSGLRNPVDLRFDRDGSLYVLLRDAWVIDDKFRPGTGSLLRIRYSSAGQSGSPRSNAGTTDP